MYAEEFLVNVGADPARMQLNKMDYTDHLVYFADPRSNIFILMVTRW